MSRPPRPQLPPGLPIPADDGACAHLAGLRLPPVTLKAASGRAVDLSALQGLNAIYIYPMSGPDGPLPDGWDLIPGARGIQLTNPTAIISWIAMIALGVKPGAPSWVPALVLTAAIAFAGTFYASMAIAFSTPNVVRLYANGKRRIDAALGAFFAFAALRLVIG